MNIRSIIKVYIGERHDFIGTFDRYALIYVPGRGTCQFIVIKNILDIDDGGYACNYAYFGDIKGFQGLSLNEGDRISFRARYVECKQAFDIYLGSLDPYNGRYYRLMNPTKIEKLRNPVRPIGYDNNKCKINIIAGKRY